MNLSLALGIARSQVGAGSDEGLAVALDEAAAELRLALRGGGSAIRSPLCAPMDVQRA